MYLLFYDHYEEESKIMRVTHSLEIKSICPVDNKPDVCKCVITTERIIPVEDILAAAKEVEDTKAYQENICQELHRRLSCQVRLVGYHSGVRTEVICGE